MPNFPMELPQGEIPEIQTEEIPLKRNRQEENLQEEEVSEIPPVTHQGRVRVLAGCISGWDTELCLERRRVLRHKQYFW